MSVTIDNIQNPSIRGGTGNFQLQTMKGNNILDQNLIFGVIGISDNIGALTSTIVTVDTTGTSSAGSISAYAFSFKVSTDIPWNSYFMFTIHDPAFGISANPTCSAFSINGQKIQGTLVCQSIGQNIQVNGKLNRINNIL